MARALLGMGSNLGDRVGHLRDAIASLADVAAVSDVYETDPVGGPDQNRYLNLVVAIDTDLGPHDLLAVCRRLEAAAGRLRTVRWGPRTLDVDVLWIDGVALDDPDLTVPHPRMWDRRFVVEPLAEVASDLVDSERLRLAQGRVDRLGPLSDL